jgi:hypothetical protein
VVHVLPETQGGDFKDELLIFTEDMGADRCENSASGKRAERELVTSILSVSLFLLAGRNYLKFYWSEHLAVVKLEGL